MYDALNVLMAMKIIHKERKEIHWRVLLSLITSMKWLLFQSLIIQGFPNGNTSKELDQLKKGLVIPRIH